MKWSVSDGSISGSVKQTGEGRDGSYRDLENTPEETFASYMRRYVYKMHGATVKAQMLFLSWQCFQASVSAEVLSTKPRMVSGKTPTHPGEVRCLIDTKVRRGRVMRDRSSGM